MNKTQSLYLKQIINYVKFKNKINKKKIKQIINKSLLKIQELYSKFCNDLNGKRIGKQ